MMLARTGGSEQYQGSGVGLQGLLGQRGCLDIGQESSLLFPGNATSGFGNDLMGMHWGWSDECRANVGGMELLDGLNFASAFVSFCGGLCNGRRWGFFVRAVPVRLIDCAFGKPGWGRPCSLGWVRL